MGLPQALACLLAAVAAAAIAADPTPGSGTALPTSGPAPGRNLAATCTGCHGTDGRALPGAGINSLAGTDQQELLQRLRDFKSGNRPATIMHQIARGYSDEQLEQIAAYFSAQK